jgi:multiple sugar transport system permease protein
MLKVQYTRRRTVPPYLWLLLPSFLLIAIFLFYPFFYQFLLSLFSTTLYDRGSFVGLRNYARVLTDPITLESGRITLTFVVLATTAEVIWGMILALTLNRITRGKRWLRGLVILPLMLTPVAVGSMWNFMFFPEGGGVSTLLRVLGKPPQVWLTKPFSALLCIVAVEVWQYTPFTALVLLAALQGIPKDLYEVASLYGCSKRQVFRFVTLPLIRGSVFIVVLFNIMRQLKTFDIVYTVTRGGPGRATGVISFNIYQRGFRFYNISEAAALSFLILIIVLIISDRIVKLMRRND